MALSNYKPPYSPINYIDVELNLDQSTFSFQERQSPPQPLTTLLKIETILRKKLAYSSPYGITFSEMTPSNLLSTLATITHVCNRGTCVEEAIHEVVSRIENLLHPPRLFPLPDELNLLILSNLPFRDLQAVALVCKNGTELSHCAQAYRARYFGIHDSLFSKAMLRKLLYTVAECIQNKIIPAKYIAMRAGHPDPEATLMNLSTLERTEIYRLFNQPALFNLLNLPDFYVGFLALYFIHLLEQRKPIDNETLNLDPLMLQWMETNQLTVIELFLKLGIDPCKRASSFSLLDYAIFKKNENFVRIFLPLVDDLSMCGSYAIISNAKGCLKLILDEIKTLDPFLQKIHLGSILLQAQGANPELLNEVQSIANSL